MRASGLADDDGERAALLSVRGMALSDRAYYDPAVTLLLDAVATARRCGDVRRAGWSLALLGRTYVLRDEVSAAVDALDESLALVDDEGWVAFQPFPEALRAEAARRQGDVDRAAALLDHAYPLGCRLGDPCWEAMAARARGLLHETTGDRAGALTWLRESTVRAVRVADPYVWIHGYCLEALAGVAIAAGEPDAPEIVAQLEQLAGRADMRELVVRAAIHRARLGDPDAMESARMLAEAIDNPALHTELAEAIT